MTAGQKAAATRAARKAAGFYNGAHTRTASAPRSATRPIYTAPPVVDPKALAYEALAKLEDALVAKVKRAGITPELEAGFNKYQKCKALAIHPATPVHEGATALRMGLIEIVKLVF